MSRAIIVMGPSGNGKSTLAKALAEHLRWAFIEGDEHHPPANIAKMARGEPLTDADRLPFLDSIAAALAAHPAGAVAACSALRRRHRDHLRDRLRDRADTMLFILPEVTRAELLRRMTARPRHFMPPSLLDSQLAALEPPTQDEACLRIDGAAPLAAQITLIARQIMTATH